MEINDGNFNCEDSKTLTAAILNWNEATINGSTFKVGESPVGAYAIYNGYGDDTYEKGSITVTDGTFIYPETSDGIIP